MSSLICNNFDLNSIQPNAFLQPLSSLKYLTKINRSGWFRDHGNDKRILVSLGLLMIQELKEIFVTSKRLNYKLDKVFWLGTEILDSN